MPRLSIEVQGIVQGVGFRPFVFRIANLHGTTGWVRNHPAGVEIEVQGPARALQAFLSALEQERPAPARIESIRTRVLPEVMGETGFEILVSGQGTQIRPSVPADLAICPDCARELDTFGERRYRYAFTNCTFCGPRYSIIEGLPYDRPLTAMKGFPLCSECFAEYKNPLDRRFHAQPIACPACGPHLRLAGPDGHELSSRDAAMEGAVRILEQGGVLALKGLGGFQLLVDATSPDAVSKLRQRKRREEKPFAVMFPTLEAIQQACEVEEREVAVLEGAAAPILLLKRSGGGVVTDAVAPRNPRLGAFLPYTPLHRILLATILRPLVCTSGNLTEEPMSIDEVDAFERLGGIADAFLTHNRPILRPVDDSVMRMDDHGPMILRRARGFAPQAHAIDVETPPILALGAHQKSTIALLHQGQVVVSQHLGDLDSLQGVRLLERTVDDLLTFLAVKPEMVACDLHSDYASTRLAEQLTDKWNLPLVKVQHHHAHVAALMAEKGISEPVLGLAWDGSGQGTDLTVWGGEALLVDPSGFQRVGFLRPYPLPGGEKAVKDPRRSAMGLCWASGIPDAVERASALFTPAECSLVHAMLERRLNSPDTSSIGRLFDAVSALIGVRTARGFEGQAAMELEFAAEQVAESAPYPWNCVEGKAMVADPGPLLQSIVEDLSAGVPVAIMAHRFHGALAELGLHWARHAGVPHVALCGGCFQNALLTRMTRRRLIEAGFTVHVPAVFPPNDGGISLGQAWVAAYRGVGSA